MRAWLLTLVFAGIPLNSARAQTLPPIQSPEQAVQQLSLASDEARLAALQNLKAACRGRLRHTLKDNKPVLAAVAELLRQGTLPVRRAGLDVVRCFSGPNIPPLLGIGLADAEPGVVSYAAEIAAQVSEPAVTELLLERLEASKAACLDPKIEAPLVERCVWLVYSSGATVGPGHSRELRERMGVLVEAQLASPHPKIREVGVESLAKTRLAKYADAIKGLLDAEKKKSFAAPNDPSLLSRFKERARALETKGEK